MGLNGIHGVYSENLCDLVHTADFAYRVAGTLVMSGHGSKADGRLLDRAVRFLEEAEEAGRHMATGAGVLNAKTLTPLRWSMGAMGYDKQDTDDIDYGMILLELEIMLHCLKEYRSGVASMEGKEKTVQFFKQFGANLSKRVEGGKRRSYAFAQVGYAM